MIYMIIINYNNIFLNILNDVSPSFHCIELMDDIRNNKNTFSLSLSFFIRTSLIRLDTCDRFFFFNRVDSLTGVEFQSELSSFKRLVPSMINECVIKHYPWTASGWLFDDNFIRYSVSIHDFDIEKPFNIR